MAGINDIIDGRYFKIEGYVRNVRDMSNPGLGPFKRASEVGNKQDVAFILQTDLDDFRGQGKAFIALFVEDCNHECMQAVRRKGQRKGVQR